MQGLGKGSIVEEINWRSRTLWKKENCIVFWKWRDEKYSFQLQSRNKICIVSRSVILSFVSVEKSRVKNMYGRGAREGERDHTVTSIQNPQPSLRGIKKKIKLGWKSTLFPH